MDGFPFPTISKVTSTQVLPMIILQGRTWMTWDGPCIIGVGDYVVFLGLICNLEGIDLKILLMEEILPLAEMVLRPCE